MRDALADEIRVVCVCGAIVRQSDCVDDALEVREDITDHTTLIVVERDRVADGREW